MEEVWKYICCIWRCSHLWCSQNHCTQTTTIIIMMQNNNDDDDNVTAQLHILSWPLGKISQQKPPPVWLETDKHSWMSLNLIWDFGSLQMAPSNLQTPHSVIDNGTRVFIENGKICEHCQSQEWGGVFKIHLKSFWKMQRYVPVAKKEEKYMFACAVL